MHSTKLLAAGLLMIACAAHAAPAQYELADFSSEALMNQERATAIWKAQVDDKLRARLHKLYPVSKWGFISLVSGGFTPDKACVVTANVMMVPRTLGNRMAFQPYKAATTFASQAGASREQCRELAEAKLSEAIVAMGTSLISP
jgi:hypothetical protein